MLYCVSKQLEENAPSGALLRHSDRSRPHIPIKKCSASTYRVSQNQSSLFFYAALFLFQRLVAAHKGRDGAVFAVHVSNLTPVSKTLSQVRMDYPLPKFTTY